MQIIKTSAEGAVSFSGAPDGTAGLRKAAAVIPGFMGSRLFAAEDIMGPDGCVKFPAGERLWIYNPLMDGCFKLKWDAGRAGLSVDNRFDEDDRIEALMCGMDGEPLNRLQTAGVDDRERWDTGAGGQYGTAGMYTDLTLKLKAVIKDSRFLPYDWRLGCRAAAAELRPALDALVGSHDVTYIVAHSMGGLVALEYIRRRGSAHGIRLVTLGTPFFGAPSALYEIETGKALPLDFGAKALLKISKNIRSAYELFPTAEYGPYVSPGGKAENGQAQARADTELFLRGPGAGLNVRLLNDAARFHRELGAARAFNALPHACAVVGHGLETPASVTAARHNGRMEFSRERAPVGDGTVPVPGATMNGKIHPSKLRYVREKHTGLVSNEAVLAFILAKTDNWERPDESRFGYDKSVVTAERAEAAAKEPTFELSVVITAADESYDFARAPAYLYDVYDNLIGVIKGDCSVSPYRERPLETTGRGGASVKCVFDVNPHDDACKFYIDLAHGREYTLRADIRRIGSKTAAISLAGDKAVIIDHVLVQIT